MKLVKEHIIDDDFYFELLNESLNEDFNIDYIKQIINKISNKSNIVARLIKKFNESRNMSTRKYVASILVIMFLVNFTTKNSRWSSVISAADIENVNPDRAERLALKIMKNNTLSLEKVENIIKPELQQSSNKLISSKFINLSAANISDTAKKIIQHHEKLRLEAYTIGDGMITVGYGHASPEKKSPYKVGDSITEEKANQLFSDDIKIAENGVKRIIKAWENPKIESKITQGMFDAMVSMAYNMGVGGLRNTEFIQLIKAGKFDSAGEKLKTTKIKSCIIKNGQKIYVEMPGLKKRRMEEYNLFASS